MFQVIVPQLDTGIVNFKGKKMCQADVSVFFPSSYSPLPPSPPPLSLAHWQGGTSEPHYCKRIYEAEPNGKEKASVNNCRELHSQL